MLPALVCIVAMAGCAVTPVGAMQGGTTNRVMTPDDPLRVLVVGDSLAGEVKLPVEAALELGGAGTLDYVSLPSLPRVRELQPVWANAITRYRPDLLIVLVGFWESIGLGARIPEALPSAEIYENKWLRLFTADATSRGAQVLWIGTPWIRDASMSRVLAELNRRFAEFADRDPNVDYLDANERVGGPGGTFAEIVGSPVGPERVRQPDGLHLCPDGSVRVAHAVLDWITDRWSVPLGQGWERAAWRGGRFSGVENCPPA